MVEEFEDWAASGGFAWTASLVAIKEGETMNDSHRSNNVRYTPEYAARHIPELEAKIEKLEININNKIVQIENLLNEWKQHGN